MQLRTVFCIPSLFLWTTKMSSIVSIQLQFIVQLTFIMIWSVKLNLSKSLVSVNTPYINWNRKWLISTKKCFCTWDLLVHGDTFCKGKTFFGQPKLRLQQWKYTNYFNKISKCSYKCFLFMNLYILGYCHHIFCKYLMPPIVHVEK